MPEASPQTTTAKPASFKIALRTTDEPLVRSASGYTMTGIDVSKSAPLEALFAIINDRLEEPVAKERLTDAKVSFIQANLKVAKSIQSNADKANRPAKA